MSTQATVRSVDAIKDFRTALALYAEDSLAALGAVDLEIRRTVMWLQHDRRNYWQEQLKRRREQVSAAQAEVFRRKLAKTSDYTPAYTEQKEALRKAEARLRDAELRISLVKKWEPALQNAILEYKGSVRRIKDMASGEVPRGLVVLEKIIDALEAYLRVAPPSGAAAISGTSPLEPLADELLGEPATSMANPAPEAEQASASAAEAPAPAHDEPPVDDAAPDDKESTG